MRNESCAKSRIAVSIADTICASAPRRRIRTDVLQQQTGLAVNEEHLLDPIEQRVQQHDLAEGPAGAARLEAPADGAPRHAVLERAVHRLDHRGEAGRDRLADGGADDREDRVGERLRIAANRRGDRFLDGRRERAGQLGIGGTVHAAPAAAPR